MSSNNHCFTRQDYWLDISSEKVQKILTSRESFRPKSFELTVYKIFRWKLLNIGITLMKIKGRFITLPIELIKICITQGVVPTRTNYSIQT